MEDLLVAVRASCAMSDQTRRALRQLALHPSRSTTLAFMPNCSIARRSRNTSIIVRSPAHRADRDFLAETFLR